MAGSCKHGHSCREETVVAAGPGVKIRGAERDIK